MQIPWPHIRKASCFPCPLLILTDSRGVDFSPVYMVCKPLIPCAKVASVVFSPFTVTCRLSCLIPVGILFPFVLILEHLLLLQLPSMLELIMVNTSKSTTGTTTSPEYRTRWQRLKGLCLIANTIDFGQAELFHLCCTASLSFCLCKFRKLKVWNQRSFCTHQ